MYINLIFLGSVLITLFFALKKFGLIEPVIKTKADKIMEKKELETATLVADRWKEEANAESFISNYKGFDPEYYQQRSFAEYIQPNSKVTDLANELTAALNGWFGDDELTVYNVFRSLDNPAQLSQISAAFVSKNGYSLNDKLISDFDDSELVKVVQIIKSWNG